MSDKVKMKMPKPLVALVTAASVAVVGGAAVTTAVLLNNNNKSNISDTENNENEAPAVTIGMEGNGVVMMEDEDYAKLWEEMERQAAEGMMDLSYKNMAVSVDGVHFDCDFGNPITNPYYMYFNIYLSGDYAQEIVRTGLVEPGMQLSSFESSIKLDPGGYEAVLVFTQVKDDMATICGQISVTLNLLVYDGVPDEDNEFVAWNTEE